MSQIDHESTERSVFRRAVSVLAAFADPPSAALTLTELSRRSGLPLTTTHRLCQQLLAESMLERLPGGEYRVGLRLWELGLLAPRAQGVREVALPFLEDLYEVTHSNVQLVVLDGREVVILERLSARNAVPLIGRAGGRLPIHAASGGLAMLAHSDVGLIESVLAEPMQRFTDATIQSGNELRAAVAIVRRQGYIECRGHVVAGSVSIAAPILRHNRTPIAAVSVIVDESADTRMLMPAILTTARAIGRALSRGPNR